MVAWLCVRTGELVAGLRVRVGELDSSRASLSRKILRKRARTGTLDSLALSTRACRSIFHQDGPDSSHCSLLGLNSPRAGEDYLVPGRVAVLDFPVTAGRAQPSQQVR